MFLTGSANNFSPGIDWRPKVAAPADRTPQQYATYLTTVAWDFLLLHEFGHIVRCHLRYLRQRGFINQTEPGAISMQEFEAVASPQVNEIRRILEVDADGIAAQIQVRAHAHNKPDVIARAALFEEDAARANWGWSDVCRAWYRAVLVLFHIMAILDKSQSLISKGTHPHPNIRMGLLANDAWHSWRDFVSGAGDYRSIALSVKGEIDRLVRDGILPASPAQFIATYTNEFREASKALRNGLSEITPDLNSLTENRFSQPH